MNLKLFILAILGALATAVGLEGIDSIYVNLGSLVAGITLISEFIIDTTNLKKKKAQFVTWIVGAGLAAIGFIYNMGVFASVELHEAIIYGVASALMANGLWREFVKQILKKMKLL